MKDPKKSRHSERDLAGAPALLCWLTSQAGRNYLTSLRPPSRVEQSVHSAGQAISCEPQATIALGPPARRRFTKRPNKMLNMLSIMRQIGWLYELPGTFRTEWRITSETELSKLLRNTTTDRPAIFFVSASWAGVLT